MKAGKDRCTTRPHPKSRFKQTLPLRVSMQLMSIRANLLFQMVMGIRLEKAFPKKVDRITMMQDDVK